MGTLRKYEPSITDSDIDPLYKRVRWDVILRWYREAHEAYFRDVHLDFGSLHERGYGVVIRSDAHDRRLPIQRDDSPVVLTRVESIGKSSFAYTQAVVLGDKLAVKSNIVSVLLKQELPTPIPQDIRSKLES